MGKICVEKLTRSLMLVLSPNLCLPPTLCNSYLSDLVIDQEKLKYILLLLEKHTIKYWYFHCKCTVFTDSVVHVIIEIPHACTTFTLYPHKHCQS